MTLDEAVERIRVASFEGPKAGSHTEWANRIKEILREFDGPAQSDGSTTQDPVLFGVQQNDGSASVPACFVGHDRQATRRDGHAAPGSASTSGEGTWRKPKPQGPSPLGGGTRHDRPRPKPKHPDPALPNEAGRLPTDPSHPWLDRVRRYLRARYP